jgi:hypothetical protein
MLFFIRPIASPLMSANRRISRPFARLCSIIAVLVMVVLPSLSYAEKRVDLYTVSQLVVDQSLGLRQQATAKGLATVLVKVSGRQDTLEHPWVKEALIQATPYLKQYTYSSTAETITLAGSELPASRLLLQYSSSAIQRLLQSAQLATWPENRPEVLLWVASQQQGKRLLDGNATEVVAFKGAGTLRGLPIVLPSLDLLDRQTLPATRLWAMDESAIRKASVRYGADGVLAGRVNQATANQWTANFLLINKNERHYFNANSTSAQRAAQQIIDQVSDYFSRRDGIVVNDEQSAQSLMIAVEGIETFARYAGLVNYLNDLPFIAGTTVTRVDGHQVILQLAYNGSEEKLLATLSASTVLESQPLVTDVTNIEPLLSARFTWRVLNDDTRVLDTP